MRFALACVYCIAVGATEHHGPACYFCVCWRDVTRRTMAMTLTFNLVAGLPCSVVQKGRSDALNQGPG